MGKKKVYLNTDRIFVYLYSSIFLLLFGIFMFVMMAKTIKAFKVQENANFVEVEATIVEYVKTVYRPTDSQGRHGIESVYWTTYYEYITEDGGSYMSYWQSRIHNEEDAKAQLGKKVPIYIDDELKLQTKTLEIDKSGIRFGAIVGTLMIAGSIGCMSVFSVLMFRRKRYIETHKQIYDGMKDFEKPKRGNSLIVLIMTISFFVMVLGIVFYFVNEKKYQTYINAQFEEVDATVYEYREFQNPRDNSLYYAMMYKYVSDNGEEFIGVWRNDIYSEVEAKEKIGASVPLYYNEDYGALKSLLYLDAVEKPNKTGYIAVITMGAIVFAVAFVRFTVHNVRLAKYDKEHEQVNISTKMY